MYLFNAFAAPASEARADRLPGLHARQSRSFGFGAFPLRPPGPVRMGSRASADRRPGLGVPCHIFVAPASGGPRGQAPGPKAIANLDLLYLWGASWPGGAAAICEIQVNLAPRYVVYNYEVLATWDPCGWLPGRRVMHPGAKVPSAPVGSVPGPPQDDHRLGLPALRPHLRGGRGAIIGLDNPYVVYADKHSPSRARAAGFRAAA